MPMAESRPPMVVGMRHTSSATTAVRRQRARRSRAPAAPASRRRTGRRWSGPTSRMWRAISLGVFCRAAPSTRAIIRSRKDSPGLAVMRTTMRSESTLVPPVTARAVAAALADDRGGLAGDGGLVDRGDALDHLAVAGDDSPASHDDQVALAQLRRRARAPRVRPRSRRAMVSLRILRSASPGPCRGPRPPPRRSWRRAR